MKKRGLHKLEIIILWILISIGIYLIATRGNGFFEGKNLQKEKQQNITVQKGNTEAAADERLDESGIKYIDTVRVLIKSSDYADIYHKELVISGQEGLHIQKGDKEQLVAADEKVCVTCSDLEGEQMMISAQNQGGIRLHNVKRKDEVVYRGSLECVGTSQGIVVINQVGLEEYLYGVVPSEMPTSYPFEALKAQAICARTYVYYHGSSYAYPEWKAQVDDSTSYQVYLNIAENETVNRAVDETRGHIMTYQGKVMESFYYATSCGCGSGYEVWGNREDGEDRAYLQAKLLTVPQKENEDEIYPTMVSQSVFTEKTFQEYMDYGRQNDIEYEEPWYRWEYDKEFDSEEKISLFVKHIYELSIQNPEQIKIESNQKKEKEELCKEKEILSITVGERTASGLVTTLYIQTEHFLIEVMSQHTIREVLATAGDLVKKKDDTTYTLGNILPSAYFYIENVYETAYKNNKLQKVVLHGGGLGHGVGMSQNGAKCLAQRSFTAEEILQYYYHNIEIKVL